MVTDEFKNASSLILLVLCNDLKITHISKCVYECLHALKTSTMYVGNVIRRIT